MRWWATLFLIGFAGTASARLGDTESQLINRYGKPTSVRPGGRYNPYFEKLIDFEKGGIAISCGIHAGKCVTIQYKRDNGFNQMEFEGFKGLNRTSSGVVIARSASSLKFTSKKDYPEIIKGSQTGLRRMRQKSETLEKENRG
jgi:hypothetical protein